MSLKIKSILFGIPVLTALVSMAPSAQAAGCTQAAAAGKYGFWLTGVLITPAGAVPAVAVGRVTIDAEGHVTGTESRNVGGDFADETVSGTLTVKADCTGTLTARFYENGQLVRTSVLDSVTVSHTELHMIQKSLILPNDEAVPVVVSVEARRIVVEDED